MAESDAEGSGVIAKRRDARERSQLPPPDSRPVAAMADAGLFGTTCVKHVTAVKRAGRGA
jgi:hypothetical protein